MQEFARSKPGEGLGAKKDLKKNLKKVAQEEISITFAAPFEEKEKESRKRDNKDRESR